MDWAREILDEIEGKKKIPALVLALVKPSVALLDLGLPPDVLYQHCRWSIRDLFRRVHPDQRKGEVISALKTLSDAFDFIKDQDVFAEALTRARDDRSYERLGERSLRERIQGLQDDIANLKAQMRRQEAAHQEKAAEVATRCQVDMRALSDVVARKEKFFQRQEAKIRFGEWFRGYLAGQMMHFSSRSRKIRPITGYMQLVVVSFAFSFSTAHTATPVEELFERIKTSGFAAPEVRLSARHVKHERGLTRKSRKDPGAVIQEGGLESFTKVAKRRYCDALEHLAHGLTGLYVSKATIIPQRITVEDQVFNGDAVTKARLHVLGTVDPAIGLAHRQVPPGGEHAPRLRVDNEILPEVEPFVCPGRAIVGLTASKSFRLIPRFPDTEWSRLLKQRQGIETNNSTLFLSHIVLDVE